MLIEYDTEADATYFELVDRECAGTVSISDLVLVDIGTTGEVLGVEVATHPSRVAADVWDRLFERFPSLDARIRTALSGVPGA